MTETKQTGNSRIRWLIGAGILLLIAAAVILLTRPGGGSDGTFSLVISLENGAEVLYDQQLDTKEEQSLLDIMEAKVPDITVSPDGLITALCGVSQDDAAGKYWLYTVNGEFATVGTGDYYPKDGDHIVFDLHAYEE